MVKILSWLCWAVDGHWFGLKSAMGAVVCSHWNLPCISVTNILLSQHYSIHYLNGQSDKCSTNSDIHIYMATFTECVLTHLCCTDQWQSNTEGPSFFVPLLDFPWSHSKVKQALNLKHSLDVWVYSTHVKRYSVRDNTGPNCAYEQ